MAFLRILFFIFNTNKGAPGIRHHRLGCSRLSRGTCDGLTGSRLGRLLGLAKVAQDADDPRSLPSLDEAAEGRDRGLLEVRWEKSTPSVMACSCLDCTLTSCCRSSRLSCRSSSYRDVSYSQVNQSINHLLPLIVGVKPFHRLSLLLPPIHQIHLLNK